MLSPVRFQGTLYCKNGILFPGGRTDRFKELVDESDKLRSITIEEVSVSGGETMLLEADVVLPNDALTLIQSPQYKPGSSDERKTKRDFVGQLIGYINNLHN